MKLFCGSETAKRGFTLLELSIVLVIIALIVAAVSSGASLVAHAKLRSVINQFGKYEVAVNSFYDQYRQFPGDMVNATSYWPSGSTADGNGNGKVEWTNNEDDHFWQQMSLSGFVAASYGDATVYGASVGISVPRTQYYHTSFWFYYQSGIYHRSGNLFELTDFNDGVLTAKEAYTIDNKMDDGLASKGKVYTLRSYPQAANNVCVDNPVSSYSADYLLTDTTHYCRMVLWVTMGMH